MSVAAKAAVHRNNAGARLSVTPHPAPPHGRHRRAVAHALGRDPSAGALLRRGLAASAAWLIAFGLLALAWDWEPLALVALASGVLIALALVGHQLMNRPTRQPANPALEAHLPRNGYGP